MYHPMLLQPEVLQELPGLLDDVRPREAALAGPCYRSEAFAEDLYAADAEPAPPRRARTGGLMFAAPLGMALVGAVMALFGQAA